MADARLPDLDRLVEFLRTTPLLDGLTDAELAELVYVVELVPVEAGHEIVREGGPGDAWYLLMEGEARVEAHGARIKGLGPRDCFGELAVLDGEPRTATVVAEGPGLVVRVSARGFEALLAAGSLAAHKVVLSLTRLLARRMRTMLREAPGHALEYGGAAR
jgi:CRP-like cAMP-binding protein